MDAVSQLALPEPAQSSRTEALTGSTASEQTIRVSRELSHENAHCLLEEVLQRLKQPVGGVVLDFSQTVSTDSSGLRVLVGSKRACDRAGVPLKLTSVPECVARSITLAGLDAMFDLGRIAEPAQEPLQSREAVSSSFEDVGICDPELISIWRNKIAQAAGRAGADGTELCDIKIAVGEALTNAYKHGSPDKKRNLITVRCDVSPERLVVEVQDEGPPFDPDAVGTPNPQKMKDHGMGIHLMRQAMDSVEFYSGCPGNLVRMTRWFNDGSRKPSCR